MKEGSLTEKTGAPVSLIAFFWTVSEDEVYLEEQFSIVVNSTEDWVFSESNDGIQRIRRVTQGKLNDSLFISEARSSLGVKETGLWIFRRNRVVVG